jgi:hypothetical protein
MAAVALQLCLLDHLFNMVAAAVADHTWLVLVQVGMVAAVQVAPTQQQPQQAQSTQAVAVVVAVTTAQTVQAVQVDQAFLFFPFRLLTTQAQPQAHQQSPRLAQTQ